MKTAYCINCGKDVEYKTDWEGVAQNTPKGIIKYKELYAFCSCCGHEIYIPEINDKNVENREKALKQLESESNNEYCPIKCYSEPKDPTCPHCQPPFEHFGRYYIKTDYPNDPGLHVLKRTDAIGGVMINHCPICGRKLEE